MGTPDFAVPCLEFMVKEGYEVCGVFTQPDRPKGRGKKLSAPPVKLAAEKLGISVYQPVRLKGSEAISIVSSLNPDLIVVTAYGKILPQEILDSPRLGCINIHASLLPKYRGAAPIQWSIINGEKTTGITSMYMAKGLDTGDMILKTITPIKEDETAGELHDRLSVLGAQNLIETLNKIKDGSAPRIPQCDNESSYAHMVDKKLCVIDWTKNPTQICNLIRGLSPFPGAMTTICGKRLKLYNAKPNDETKTGKPGEVLGCIVGEGILIACKEGAIIVKELQGEGSRRMPAEDYLRGHPIANGTILGKEEK